jgi:hypothetical protein
MQNTRIRKLKNLKEKQKKNCMDEGSWNLIHHSLSTYIAEVINAFKANNYTTGVTVSYRQYCNYLVYAFGLKMICYLSRPDPTHEVIQDPTPKISQVNNE